jgi:CPA1 family monovalent cation:H+ antiporter
MGVVAGALVGYAASAVIHRVDDAMLEITLTTIAAYGSFVVAEQLHYSGVIATVTAGMLCGNTAVRTGMSPTTRVAVATFWEYTAFALNSLVFLLIGFQVQLGELLAAWQPIVAAYLAVTLGRVAVIGLVSYLLSRSKERISARWAAVLSWGGLRGSLSMVLVLGLPLGLPHRGVIITMAFGVVVLTILVQGLTMKPLLGRLGLLGTGSSGVYERLRAAARGTRAALKEVEAMRADAAVSPAIAQKLASEFSARLAQTERELSEMDAREGALGAEERRLALRRALVAEKDAINAAFHSGQLGDESYDALRKDVDRRLQETDNDSL